MRTMSVFIPTHNRVIELRRALCSLVIDNREHLIENDIEIVISSNSDIDVENEIITVEFFRKYYRRIRYLRSTRDDIDDNQCRFYKCVETDYCLLLADDDLVLVGGVEHVISCTMRDELFVIFNSYKIRNNRIKEEILYNEEHDLILSGKDFLKTFLEAREPFISLSPLLPFYGGILVNLRKIRGENLLDRDIYTRYKKTMHQYVGILIHMLLVNDNVVMRLYRQPAIAIAHDSEKQWSKSWLNDSLIRFYSSLPIDETCKKIIMDRVAARGKRNG